MREAKVVEFFPIPVYMENLPPLGQKIKGSLLNENYVRSEDSNCFYTPGFNILDKSEYKELHDKIIDSVNYFAFDNLQLKKNYTWYIQSSWVNKHREGDFAGSHIHENALLSGVYYISAPEHSGDLVFTRDWRFVNLFPSTINLSFEQETFINSKRGQITPEDDLLVIFPSHLSHSVAKSQSKEYRYSLAFNLFVKGEIGEGISSLRL